MHIIFTAGTIFIYGIVYTIIISPITSIRHIGASMEKCAHFIPIIEVIINMIMVTSNCMSDLMTGNKFLRLE